MPTLNPTNYSNKLVRLWCTGMQSKTLCSGARAHIERVMADEYRMQQPSSEAAKA